MNNRARCRNRAMKLIKVHYGGYYQPPDWNLECHVSMQTEVLSQALKAIATAAKDAAIRLWKLRNRKMGG